MLTLEWDNMGMKIDGQQLHHLRFADDIVLITPNISQALTKTMFMRDELVSCAPFTLNGTNISECSSYIYLGREINMLSDLTP
ncbi:unnamed protein product [Angiostrongylus costaricensis]|uniref:Reverse transcriptase domain-containing protein n=1 Tax=Angiostrongylus costaricensis TaxID=334426 RepID=A0A0R3PDP4_ANGCS|nr:unnamed protein product [Angiostrongylus costaricensis]